MSSGLTNHVKKSVTLRQRAETMLSKTKQDIAEMAVKDVQQLVNELQVHQIELEMQNEELRRAQMELQAARDRYVDLYDFSPAGHLTLDTHGKIVEANLEGSDAVGRGPERSDRRTADTIYWPEHQRAFHRHAQEALRTGLRQTCEVRIRKEGADDCYVHFESLALQDELRRTTHCRTAMLDISDRRRVEQELDTQRQQLEAIIESAMDAMITVDARQRVVLFNRAAESMFRCPAADALGQRSIGLSQDDFERPPRSHGCVRSDRQRPPARWGEAATLFGLRASGEEFPVEASISHVEVSARISSPSLFGISPNGRLRRRPCRPAEAFTRAVFDSLPVHVCVLDKDGVILRRTRPGKSLSPQRRKGRSRSLTSEIIIWTRAGEPPSADESSRPGHFQGHSIRSGRRQLQFRIRLCPHSAKRAALVPPARDSTERGERRRAFAYGYLRSGANGLRAGGPCGPPGETAGGIGISGGEADRGPRTRAQANRT